jgi:hypothetical protein
VITNSHVRPLQPHAEPVAISDQSDQSDQKSSEPLVLYSMAVSRIGRIGSPAGSTEKRSFFENIYNFYDSILFYHLLIALRYYNTGKISGRRLRPSPAPKPVHKNSAYSTAALRRPSGFPNVLRATAHG